MEELKFDWTRARYRSIKDSKSFVNSITQTLPL